MDLDDVRIFTNVVEAGSFTGAAKLLDMPKSTVSRRVAELEDDLGVTLLQRTTRSLHLTPEGDLYFNRTKRIVDELHQARLALEEMRAEPRGLLRITVPQDLDELVLDLVLDFREQYPLVELAVFATDRRVDLVTEGFDLALRAGQLPDSSLVAKRLYRTRRCLFASPAYLKCHGTPESVAELEKHACLQFSHDSTSGRWELHGPEGRHEVSVSGPLAFSNFESLGRATRAGAGIGFLPAVSVAADVAEGRLRRILADYSGRPSGLYAVYPSPRHLSPKLRAFLDFSALWIERKMRVYSPE